MERILIDRELCTLCGICIPVCVRQVLREENGEVKVTDETQCILCGHCKAVCPEDALQIPALDSEEFEPIPGKEDLPGAEELMALFRSRRSSRIFRKDSVEKEKLEMLIQAGRFAPTGGNLQPVRYVVIHTPRKLAEIRDMTLETLLHQADRIERAVKRHGETGEALSLTEQLRQSYITRWREMPGLLKQGDDRLFYHAPAFIACHVNPAISSSAEVDACLAAMQMVLMAETLGLGTCFCGFFVFAAEQSLELRRALGIPQEHKVPVSFMVGYPDVNFRRTVSREPARVKWV